MAIYRGAGGAGDATGDSASEALLVRQLSIEVQADADAAEAARAAAVTAQIAAELAETNAETAEANAETAETNAETAATNAAASASAASTSATNAANSATAAQTAETNAETAETNAETAQAAAASSASAASTSASNAATSATNASNSATAAATSATNASNSATAAASSASAASTSATNAANSATAASGSATSAASSASTATTQAGLASTSASNAATSESNAASSASAAATSASNAATSATNASNSASAASTSASNASSSEIAAAASAAAAAASYDSFDDRYLGAKSAAPTLDNDGNALVTGALYYNNGTVTPADKGMYVYDGTQWIAASAASTAILVVYKYTATSGQTTFSGNDDNSVALAYTAGSIIVTLNGVVLESGSEYTATNGTSVVLASGAATGDELNIHAFSTFDIANVYTQTQSDARFFNVTGDSISGNLTFTGTGNRITGDMSNATHANRIAFQTSTTDGATSPFILPNGTGTTASIVVANASNPTNSAFGQLRVTSSSADILSGTIGSGTALPLTMYTGGSERLRIDTSGQLGIGTSSPGYRLDVAAGDTTAGLGYAARLRSNSTAGAATLQFTNNAVSAQNAYITADDSQNLTLASGTGYARLWTNGSERMRIDSSGNVGIGTSSPAQKLTLGANNVFRLQTGSVTLDCTPTPGGIDGFVWNQSVSNGYYDWATAGNVRMRLDTSGNLLVGTTSQYGSAKLSVNGSIASGTGWYTRAGASGALGSNLFNIQWTGSAALWIDGTNIGNIQVSSDYRIKRNIETQTAPALERVMALRPVTYQMADYGTLFKATDDIKEGFIAHEVQEVIPSGTEGVKDDENQIQSLRLDAILAVAVKAIQELKSEVDLLKAQLESK